MGNELTVQSWYYLGVWTPLGLPRLPEIAESSPKLEGLTYKPIKAKIHPRVSNPIIYRLLFLWKGLQAGFQE